MYEAAIVIYYQSFDDVIKERLTMAVFQVAYVLPSERMSSVSVRILSVSRNFGRFKLSLIKKLIY